MLRNADNWGGEIAAVLLILQGAQSQFNDEEVLKHIACHQNLEATGMANELGDYQKLWPYKYKHIIKMKLYFHYLKFQ